MIILHENLDSEAESIANSFKDVFNLDSRVIRRDLTNSFVPIDNFESGFLYSPIPLRESLKEFAEKKVFILTPRDIYANKVSQEDDWIFGFCWENLTLGSTARMKRWDNKPSSSLIVPQEHYFKRLESLAIHEIGHDVVKAPHYKMATWVNRKTGYKLNLGPHCTDNTCVMYEVVDIKAPPKEEGFMLLGDEEKYDTGLDEVLARANSNWFCDLCKPSIVIDDSYRL